MKCEKDTGATVIRNLDSSISVLSRELFRLHRSLTSVKNPSACAVTLSISLINESFHSADIDSNNVQLALAAFSKTCAV